MPFRVGHGEFASYKCPRDQYFQSNPMARPEFKVTCKHDLSNDTWKYYYFEDDTIEFDPDNHQWETCAKGSSIRAMALGPLSCITDQFKQVSVQENGPFLFFSVSRHIFYLFFNAANFKSLDLLNWLNKMNIKL